jgi:hypothetical protein
MAVKRLIILNLINMKKYLIIASSLLLLLLTWTGCTKDFPVDEDGLLITGRGECYVSNFELLGTDYVSVRAANASGSTNAIIDTTAQTIEVTLLYGTDLTRLYPQFSLVTDAKLDPKIIGWMDFSDLATPKQWTVISGNRLVKKTYTVYITVQPKP